MFIAAFGSWAVGERAVTALATVDPLAFSAHDFSSAHRAVRGGRIGLSVPIH
jgi:hypothetical protein